ncbi:hypothetical protein TNCV_4209321 [Trichonephila clavipes]|nr:hypothetical protein TNCV_4209321 [Trichonephila clavipes]
MDRTITRGFGCMDRTITRGTGCMDRTITRGTGCMDRTLTREAASRGRITREAASTDRRITRVSCHECCRDFPSNNLLEIHYDKHHYIRQCPNCNKIFIDSKKHLKHLRSHLNYSSNQGKICLESCNKKGDLCAHKIEKRICRVCSLNCDDHPSLTRHLTTHAEPTYECSRCGARFSRPIDRNTHTQNHNLRCELCKIQMKSRDDLLYHVNEEHQTNKMDHVPVLMDPLLEYPNIAITGVYDNSDSMAESSSLNYESDESSSADNKSNGMLESSSLNNESDGMLESSALNNESDDMLESSSLNNESDGMLESSSSDDKSDIAESSSLDEKSDTIKKSSSSDEKSDTIKESSSLIDDSDSSSIQEANADINSVYNVKHEDNKEPDLHEKLCRELKKVEKYLGGDCKINFSILKSPHCTGKVCSDMVGEKFIHYHFIHYEFPHELVFDVNLSTGRNPDPDLGKLSDTILPFKNKMEKNPAIIFRYGCRLFS